MLLRRSSCHFVWFRGSFLERSKTWIHESTQRVTKPDAVDWSATVLGCRMWQARTLALQSFCRELASSNIIVPRSKRGRRGPRCKPKRALMNLSRLTLATFVAALLFVVVVAQTPRRPASSRPAPNPAATPAPAVVTPSPVANSDPASAPLATVNDTTITAADIESDVRGVIMQDPDPYLHDFYTDPAKATKEARERAVDARVSSMLIAAEAKKRGKATNDFIESEINAKIPAPTDQEIRAAYDAHRDQIGSADLESVRTELVNFIRNQRRTELYGTLVNRLKMTNVVSKNADVNAPNLAAGAVLVSVNGDPLRIDAINERMKAYVYK